jgi:hypothetical protein
MNAKRTSKPKIESIYVEKCIDNDPDMSYIGEYSDNPENGSIERASGEFVGDIRHRASLIERLENRIDDENEYCAPIEEYETRPESEKIIRWRKRIEKVRATGPSEFRETNGREYRYFTPYAGGEKWGSPDYRKYAKQDFERMEAYNDCGWCYVGIIAKAKISIDGTIQTIRSGGVWGVESDSGYDYMMETASDQITDLTNQLCALGFGARAITHALDQWDRKFTE